MKICVNSTFSYIKFNLNYGSALQIYALQSYLRNRGHDVFLLRDYRANPKYIINRFKNARFPKEFYSKIIALIKLQNFLRKHVRLSPRGYFSYKALVKHCPQADCHIVGSDQVWHNANNFRYLTYVPEKYLKLSYAASFGRVNISQDMKKQIKPYLKRFDGISVRESSGVEIIRSIGLDAIHVLDPTLLLDMNCYPDVEVHVKNAYIYCYFLNLKSKQDVMFEEIVSFSALHKVSLYVTAPLNYPLFCGKEAGFHLVFPSVYEWLGFYKNANCIFTNTYHGLLFCIIYKKQFVLFVQSGSGAAENERFVSILKLLDLTDRMVETGTADFDDLIYTPIDWNKVYVKLELLRKITDDFFTLYGI